MALALPDDDIATIAVLGAVGPDKGARRLERLAELVRATGARVRFVLIGYMDVQHGPWQSDDAVLTVHGRYDPRELPALFAHYRVRSSPIRPPGPRHSASRCRRRGRPAARCTFRRSARWPSASQGPAPDGRGRTTNGATKRRCSRAWSRPSRRSTRRRSRTPSERARPRSATDAGSDGGAHARALRQRRRVERADDAQVVRSNGRA